MARFMDWAVQPKSNIRRLPKILWPAAVVARNVRALFDRPHHQADGITTVHIPPGDQRFQRAYSRAVRAAGWDYKIPYRVHQALWASRLAQGVEGDFVELGTGRGFIMSALLEDGLSRPTHLFDTFLPNALDERGRQTGEQNLYYADTFERVRDNFAEWPNVTLHRGNAYDTLPAAGLSSVAFLHVDMNHPDPEEFGIRQLWPLMPSGAVMLLDDYAFAGCERQHERHNKLARELGFDILSTPTGQGIVVKPR